MYRDTSHHSLIVFIYLFYYQTFQSLNCFFLYIYFFLSHSQAMEYSGVPSVTLIVGCGLSCIALITLAVVYAVLWRYILLKCCFV